MIHVEFGFRSEASYSIGRRLLFNGDVQCHKVGMNTSVRSSSIRGEMGVEGCVFQWMRFL